MWDLLLRESSSSNPRYSPLSQEGKENSARIGYCQKEMKPGDYMIRAYTHWNRNFPDLSIYSPFVG